MTYEVQHYTLCEGWINNWTVDGKKETFDTKEEAQAALDELFHEIKEEIEYGERQPDNGYDVEEFRIVKIPKLVTKTIKLEKAFYGDFCDWPEVIEVQVTSEAQQTIDKVTNLIKQNDEIGSVNIELPEDFLSHKEQRRLFDACAYDISYLIINRYTFYFYLQGKYDAHIQAEYGHIQ